MDEFSKNFDHYYKFEGLPPDELLEAGYFSQIIDVSHLMEAKGEI